jgi:hypothetical protein
MIRGDFDAESSDDYTRRSHSDRLAAGSSKGRLTGAAIAGKEPSRMRANPGEERCAALF